MSKIRSCGQSNLWSNTSIKGLQPASRMADFGYKRQFILLGNTPQINGRPGPNPHVECGLCGFRFHGGASRQKSHLRGIKGRGITTCAEIAQKDPELAAELEHEEKQEQAQKELERKRAASSASNSSVSKPLKQQKLESGFAKQSKAEVDAAVAAFFYAEGIPFVKVGRRCFVKVGRWRKVHYDGGSQGAVQRTPVVMDIQLLHAGSEQIFQKDAGSCCQLRCRLPATQL